MRRCQRTSVTVDDDRDGPQEVAADAVVTAILAELAVRARHLGSTVDEATTVRLGHERRVDRRELPSGGVGLLRVRSTAGRPVALSLDGSTVDGLPVRFGAEVVFRAYADGHMSIVDVDGTTAVRCAAWPVLTDHAALELTRMGCQYQPFACQNDQAADGEP